MEAQWVDELPSSSPFPLLFFWWSGGLLPSQVPLSELVVADVLVLEQGDRVPADCLVVAGAGVSVDEAALTGESDALAKHPATPQVHFSLLKK